MRFCIFILLGVAVTAIAQPAGKREAAYESLRNDARLTKLLADTDVDIKAGHYEAALKKADEAVALQPANPIALNARGAALTELKRFDEGAKALDAAVAADPKGFAPQFNQGEILFLQKKYSDAALHFTDLQNRFGSIPILKYKIYLCYALDGRKEKARAALAQMRYPQDDVAWYFAYAVDRLLDNKTKEARRLIAVADAINTREAGTYRDTLRDTDLLK